MRSRRPLNSTVRGSTLVWGKLMGSLSGHRNTLSAGVHTKKHNKLLHDRMKDLVFVKFNSKLRQKRENNTRDPIVVEDEEDDVNEWITGIIPNGEGEQEQVIDLTDVSGSSSQGIPVEHKRKRGCQAPGTRKKKKFFPVLDDEEASASSSEDEDDNDTIVPSPSASNSSSDDDLE
ncbi:hypothetical protein EJB05_56569, partial [Eragrostis curvula]